MVAYAFRETKSAAAEITKLFDFIWPTAIALWNMRWQVNGFLEAVPNASYQDVHARFVVGSGIHGADVRAMQKRISWEDQKERFAEVVLTNAFSIYESWARQILARSGVLGFTDRDLYRRGGGPSRGLGAFIATVNSTSSTVMTKAFQPQFVKHKKYLPALVDTNLRCYRYFKEVRNCQMHNGGMVDQKAVDAFNDFVPVSSGAAMKTKEKIEHLPLTLGGQARVTIRGVVGFCDILLRLMITVDAELSGSEMAEKAAIERIRESTLRKLMLGGNKNSALRKVRKICTKADLPQPIDVDAAKKFLLLHNVVAP
jgi:hypothetical protein